MKKLLAIFLASAMVLSMAACGSKTDTTAEETTAKETQAAETKAAETKAVETNANEAAAETKSAEASAADEHATITIGLRKQENVIDFDENELTKWLEEQANVDIEFVYFSTVQSEYLTQIATMMAAGEKLPDMLFGITFPNETQAEYDADGYFVDLGKWLNDPEYMAAHPGFMEQLEGLTEDEIQKFFTKNINSEDGGWYHIGNITKPVIDDCYTTLWINKSWLDKLGLEMPTTYEEYVEVLRAFRDGDPNGNGVADEIPLIGAINTCESTTAWDDPIRMLINNWVYYNEDAIFNADNGKLWLPMMTDEYREALKNIHGLVEENLLSTLVYTIAENSELKSLYFPENGIATVGSFSGHLTKVTTTDSPILYDIQPVAPFKYAPFNDITIGKSVSITTDCENPEAAMRILMTLYTREGTMRQRYGVPGVDWEESLDPADGHKTFTVLNPDAFTGKTSSTWGTASASTAVSIQGEGSFFTKTYVAADPITDTKWTDYRAILSRDYKNGALASGEKNNPSEMVTKINLPVSAIEELGDIQTEFMSYIRQARSEFITGVKDINDDAEWNNYLETCKKLGSDKLVEVYQQTYDKMEK